jgi:adenylate cyclase
VAARLQEAAPVGGVLVGENTRKRLPDDIPLVGVRNLRLKGKDAPVDAFLLQLPLPYLEEPGHRTRRPRDVAPSAG